MSILFKRPFTKQLLSFILVIAGATLSTFACKARQSAALRSENHSAAPGKLSFCAALRGNGTYMPTHFGALSRVIEDYGEVSAISGGSSGSITAFLYESMEQNTFVVKEGHRRQLQIALLLKSLMGYIDILGGSNQALAVTGLLGLGNEVSRKSFQDLTKVDLMKAAANLHTLLADPTIASLINPVVLNLLVDADNSSPPYANPIFKVKEAITAAQVLVAFEATDSSVLFREGIINFDGAAQAFGHMGNFYAGLDKVSGPMLGQFLESCTEVSAHRTWNEIVESAPQCRQLLKEAVNTYFSRATNAPATLPTAEVKPTVRNVLGSLIPKSLPNAVLKGAMAYGIYKKSTALYKKAEECAALAGSRSWEDIVAAAPHCQQILKDAIDSYLAQSSKVDSILDFGDSKPRIKQAVGTTIPAFLPSAILKGKVAVDAFKKGLERYRQNRDPQFDINFSDVRFGFFVPTNMLQILDPKSTKEKFSGDGKLEKMELLNNGQEITWETVLKFSPMEPGLSRIQEDLDSNGERAFIGGWGDLHPTQILRAAGCEKIIYLSRRGPESSFVTQTRSLNGLTRSQRNGVAELLNMDADQQTKLYDPINPNSGYNRALGTADAVWCTDWDSAKAGDFRYMFDHSYGRLPSTKDQFQTSVSINNNKPEVQSFFATNSERVPVLKEVLTGCAPPL